MTNSLERWLSLEDFDNEVWKDVEGYEGLYMVSNYGRVKSIERVVQFYSKGKESTLPIKPMIKKEYDNGNGYKFISLYKNNTSKRYYIHRLVASAFIPNPNNYPQINHIDYDRGNNKVENLEWCTQSQNMKHSGKHISEALHRIGRVRPINVYRIDGTFVKRYECALDMEKDGFCRRAAYNVCVHRNRQWKGHVFRFDGDPFTFPTCSHSGEKVKIYKYDLDKNLVTMYNSIKEAERDNGFKRNYIYSSTICGTRDFEKDGYIYSYNPPSENIQLRLNFTY